MTRARHSERTRGVLLLLAGTALVAIMDALVKLLSASFGTVQIVWGRYTTQAILLFLAIAPHRSMLRLRTRRLPLHLFRACLLLAATIIFFAALKMMSLADPNAVFFSSPLLITVFSGWLLGEVVGARRWAAVAAGFGGVLLVIQPASGVLGWTAVLPLLAAVCSALYHVTTPLLARTEDPANTLYFTALVAGVALSVIVPFFWMPLTASGLLGLLVIGILGTAGHFFLIRAFEIAPAATLSPFMYLYLLWATGLGWLIFSDIPGVSTILGAIIIFGSGLCVYRLPTPATGAGKLSPPAVQGPP